MRWLNEVFIGKPILLQVLDSLWNRVSGVFTRRNLRRDKTIVSRGPDTSSRLSSLVPPHTICRVINARHDSPAEEHFLFRIVTNNALSVQRYSSSTTFRRRHWTRTHPPYIVHHESRRRYNCAQRFFIFLGEPFIISIIPLP